MDFNYKIDWFLNYLGDSGNFLKITQLYQEYLDAHPDEDNKDKVKIRKDKRLVLNTLKANNLVEVMLNNPGRIRIANDGIIIYNNGGWLKYINIKTKKEEKVENENSELFELQKQYLSKSINAQMKSEEAASRANTFQWITIIIAILSVIANIIIGFKDLIWNAK